MGKWVAFLAGWVFLVSPPASLGAEGVTLPKDLALPADVTVALYLPKHLRDFRSTFRWSGGFQTTDAVQLGSSFEELTLTAAEHFFKSSFMYEGTRTAPFGLLVSIHPSIKSEDQQVVVTAHYQVFDASGASLLKGDSVARWAPRSGVHPPDVLGTLAQDAITRALTDIVAQLRPSAGKFPAKDNAQVKIENLVDRDHPVGSGSGFFLNYAGQVLTAAHVVHDCAIIQVAHGSESPAATITASSALLDLAVLDTHASSERALRFRPDGRSDLGESVVNIGFPLQSLMTDAPTVTRGTLSSRAGLSGSVGQFQFSAPIQPGASGGPVIGAAGEVLGVAVGTLNAAELLKEGVLPQNVNFALDARYVEKFLQRNSVAFAKASGDPGSSVGVPLDEVLPAVVSVKCYQ